VDATYDVAIVGYGPVGQMAAILLGRLGHSVAVFERWPSLYPRPRAVHYDDEVARIFQRVGLAERLQAITEPATTYEWKNARGQTLLLLDRSEPGPSGWPAATMFTQPQLEALLDETAKALSGVDVFQGWDVSDVQDTGEEVRVSARSGHDVEGRFQAGGEERVVSVRCAIGCDGANSLVRERMGTAVEDLGFVFDWLIADTVPHDPTLLAGVNMQRCDPARPTTLVSGGPGRRRWEWMLLAGETHEQVQELGFVWSLLAQSGVTEADVRLERYAVYTFRARWAERWRAGRLLLAGDAAHLMPPFAGQGMCSGIRDAFTLSWQLDLVLKGVADEALLDSYTSERRAHLQHAIGMSVELGKVMCITDEAQAAARDEFLLAAAAAADPGAQPIEPPPALLGAGIRDARSADEVTGADDNATATAPPAAGAISPTAGSLFPQARVAIGGRDCLLEDAIDGGFTLYVLDEDAETVLDGGASDRLRELGATLVRVDAQLDVANVYREWFRTHGCAAALVRPDFYVFGTATTHEQVPALVGRLDAALTHSKQPEERLTR
jgi:2-polyprenyl-6-methoxyphenol hydroxylase-like FAD-dependent oxidoreductase